MNGDGRADIVVTNSKNKTVVLLARPRRGQFPSNTVSVLLGNGNGTFQGQQTFATGSFPYSIAVGDVNGDGIPDLVVANSHRPR